MNKTLVIIIVIIVLAVGGYYLMGKKDAALTPEDGSAMNGEGMTADAGGFTGSLGDLAKRGGDLKCGVSADNQVAGTAGTVYVSGPKISGSFVSETDGQKVESRMIQDGEFTYVWSSAFPQGFKMAIAEGNTAAAVNPSGMSGKGFDANTAYAWDCDPWTADASVFDLPAGVTFMEAPLMQ